MISLLSFCLIIVARKQFLKKPAKGWKISFPKECHEIRPRAFAESSNSMPLPIYLGTAALLWSRVFSPLFPVFSSAVSPAPMIKCFQYVEHYFFFAFDSVFDSAYTVDRGKGKALCLLHLAGGPLLMSAHAVLLIVFTAFVLLKIFFI